MVSIFNDKRPTYGQDPHVTMVEGLPLLCESIDEKSIAISTLGSLQSPFRVDTTIVWNNDYEQQVWAPELHHIDGLWYIYYASSDGCNHSHRTYVLQAPHFLGPYLDLSRVGPDTWGIDMTTFEWWDGNRYAIWSGWDNNGDEFPQNLYIGKMETPWKIRNRVRLAIPEFEWEKSISPILEGPQVWIEGGKLSILYSANASWKQEYSTGLLTMVGNNPLNPEHWEKRSIPLMTNAGHGCVVDNYFIYHKKLSAFPGWSDRVISSIKVEDL